MDFAARYDERMPRSHELFERARRIIPAGAGSSARTFKFGWVPYPPFIAQGTGSRMTDVDGHEYIDYLLGLGPMILGHRHPVGHQGGARRRGRPGHLLRGALRARDRGGPEGRRRGAQRRDGALHQLGQRGRGHRRAPGAGGHRAAPAGALRGSLPRLAGRRVLEQPRRPRRGRAGRPSAAGGLGPRRAPGARRHAHRAVLERPRELSARHGRARRRDRRGHHRAGHVQHRLHPAAPRLPRAAARRDAQARRSAHLRRGHHRLSLLPRRRPGMVRRDARPDDHGQGPRRRLPGGRHRRQRARSWA